jgi:hypothetical protein
MNHEVGGEVAADLFGSSFKKELVDRQSITW